MTARFPSDETSGLSDEEWMARQRALAAQPRPIRLWSRRRIVTLLLGVVLAVFLLCDVAVAFLLAF